MSTADEVLEAAAALVDAFGRHDTAAYFACFDPEATFVFHPSPQVFASRAEYEEEWATWERTDDFHVESCASTDQRVQELGDVAVFTHRVTTVTRTKDGEETLQERETIVFRRSADGWLAVHEHLSPYPTEA
jgi:ketosteroid isomerase-like protein